VGGVPAQVLYTGNFGALQVNFRVPANAPVGDAIPLVLTVGGRPSSSAVTMAVRSARRRVLVLSDNAAIRRRLAGILGRAGYPVLTWRGQQGATAQAAGPPDLIIFDLAMPKEEVSEIVRTLRIIRPQLRILATSSALDPESLRAADFLGAQAILARPLNAVQVLARVRTLLEMRPAVY
jgi:CheY-like chemotaxis protein